MSRQINALPMMSYNRHINKSIEKTGAGPVYAKPGNGKGKGQSKQTEGNQGNNNGNQGNNNGSKAAKSNRRKERQGPPYSGSRAGRIH